MEKKDSRILAIAPREIVAAKTFLPQNVLQELH